jgi:hypothetical protein
MPWSKSPGAWAPDPNMRHPMSDISPLASLNQYALVVQAAADIEKLAEKYKSKIEPARTAFNKVIQAFREGGDWMKELYAARKFIMPSVLKDYLHSQYDPSNCGSGRSPRPWEMVAQVIVYLVEAAFRGEREKFERGGALIERLKQVPEAKKELDEKFAHLYIASLMRRVMEETAQGFRKQAEKKLNPTGINLVYALHELGHVSPLSRLAQRGVLDWTDRTNINVGLRRDGLLAEIDYDVHCDPTDAPQPLWQPPVGDSFTPQPQPTDSEATDQIALTVSADGQGTKSTIWYLGDDNFQVDGHDPQIVLGDERKMLLAFLDLDGGKRFLSDVLAREKNISNPAATFGNLTRRQGFAAAMDGARRQRGRGYRIRVRTRPKSN